MSICQSQVVLLSCLLKASSVERKKNQRIEEGFNDTIRESSADEILNKLSVSKQSDKRAERRKYSYRQRGGSFAT